MKKLIFPFTALAVIILLFSCKKPDPPVKPPVDPVDPNVTMKANIVKNSNYMGVEEGTNYKWAITFTENSFKAHSTETPVETTVTSSNWKIKVNQADSTKGTIYITKAKSQTPQGSGDIADIEGTIENSGNNITFPMLGAVIKAAAVEEEQ